MLLRLDCIGDVHALSRGRLSTMSDVSIVPVDERDSGREDHVPRFFGPVFAPPSVSAPTLSSVEDDSGASADPVYPRLIGGEALYQRQYHQAVWAGDARRLLMLQSKIQDALERVFKQEVGLLGPRPTEDDYGRFDSKVDQLRDELRLRVTVRGKDDRWKHEGDLGTILQNVELDDIHEISMRNSAVLLTSKSAIDVRFRTSMILKAVDLIVKGADETWVAGVFDELRRQMQRGKPLWSFMRWQYLPMLASSSAFFAVLGMLYAIFPSGALSEDQQLTAWVLLFTGYALLLGGLIFGLPRALPNFEVFPDGQKSTGGHRLAIVIGLASFMAGNVVIPLILSVVID
jgi:hypothetical protein